MAKANLFLIGAAKAGTTALAEILCAHNAIGATAIKEPGHFCTDIYENGFSASYKNMLRWDEEKYFDHTPFGERHIAFVKEARGYEALVNEANGTPYILDASTAYLYSIKAAGKVAAYNPEAKIVVCLRNPVTRAYSHYNMAMKYGKEQRSFLQALQAESELKSARWGWEECYLHLGLYEEQLDRWYKHFDPAQILVVFQEDLKNRPQVVLEEVRTFLNLEDGFENLAHHTHRAEVPKNALVGKLLGRSGSAVAAVLPSMLKNGLKKLILSPPKAMDEEARSFLLRYFAPSIEALEQRLGKDLTHWK